MIDRRLLPAEAAPAFVHVDVDDYWALCECYGLKSAPEVAHSVTHDALPRLRSLFDRHAIRATFFAVGRDLEDSATAELYRELSAAGHLIGNHSYSHRLDFRILDPATLRSEVERAEALIESAVGARPQGFRAPGYGASAQLHALLESRGYVYDSSVMAGPYGFAFRWMDARMRRRAGGGNAGGGKTQFSYLSDARVPLAPHRVAGGHLWEFPVAASPLLRLPFQAGVCMRLGQRYFEANLRAWRRRPDVPLLFLIHAADIADFSNSADKFFREIPYFAQPAEAKTRILEQFLRRIREERPIVTTESWISEMRAT